MKRKKNQKPELEEKTSAVDSATAGDVAEAQATVTAPETAGTELNAAHERTDDVISEEGTNVSQLAQAAASAFLDSELGEYNFTDVDLEADETASEGSELEAFESQEVEDIEDLPSEKIQSVVESLLFSTDKPMSAMSMKSAFQGTNVKIADIRAALEGLRLEYAGGARGVMIEEVAGGFQIRTKPENLPYLQRTTKVRPFKLSGPALEVLSIIAYKQPCTKSSVDEIRGVECGHLMRGLLDRGLISFAGKSELPGRPMLYETTRKFLEIFSLRNINELPTLEEMDQLIPSGIGDEETAKPKLSDLTGELSQSTGSVYSENEEELMDISSDLAAINTTSAFFEEEKRRQREKRDADRAQDISERITIGEDVDEKDRRWLAKYEAEKAAAAAPSATTTDAAVSATTTDETTAAAAVADASAVTETVMPAAEGSFEPEAPANN